MYYICKSCDDCCRSCCQCCETCCGECCDAIAQCFSTPFSYCTFITFFISVIPFIIAIVALIQSKDLTCQKNIKEALIIQAICNLLNFIFCLYLMCQYGVYAKDEPNGQEKSFLEKTKDLILYDWIVCFYIFALIFFFIWLIIGFSWLSGESSLSPCYQQNSGFLITALQINLWTMIVYMIAGAVLFLVTIIIYGCDEGSCSCMDLVKCCCTVMTCGVCKFDKKKNKDYYNQKKDKYDDSRKGWIHSGKRLIGFLGIGNNPRVNTMNNNMSHNQPGYAQPVYVQPPPPPPPQKSFFDRFRSDPNQQGQSFWDRLDCFKSNSGQRQPPRAQQYQQPVYQAQQPAYQPVLQPQYQQQIYQPQQFQQQQAQQQQYYPQQQNPYNYQYQQPGPNGWGK